MKIDKDFSDSLTVIGMVLNLVSSILLAYSATEQSGIGINGQQLMIFTNAPGHHFLTFDSDKFYWGIGLLIAGAAFQLIAYSLRISEK